MDRTPVTCRELASWLAHYGDMPAVVLNDDLTVSPVLQVEQRTQTDFRDASRVVAFMVIAGARERSGARAIDGGR